MYSSFGCVCARLFYSDIKIKEILYTYNEESRYNLVPSSRDQNLSFRKLIDSHVDLSISLIRKSQFHLLSDACPILFTKG